MDHIMTEIIKAAASAPSVANSQPWSFSIKDNKIQVHLDKKRAESFGNTGNTVTYTTIGGVVENITIAAQHFGFATDIKFFPVSINQNLITEIHLIKDRIADTPLFKFIFSRHTNRRLYNKSPIQAHISKSLTEMAQSFMGARLYWIEDKTIIDKLALLVKQTETIMYEHPRLHSDLFKWMRWTQEEVMQTGDGLSIKTLEINKFQEIALKYLSSWKTMNLLNRFNISSLVSDYSYRLVKNSPALGFIVMESRTPEDYINGGRLFERIWITATSHGLSLHPMCPVVVLPTIYLLLNGNGFNEKHQQVLMHVLNEMAAIFQIKPEKAMVMFFRIGYASPPTERSLRRPMHDIIII